MEVVPAGPARDLGWDRSLVGAYGQDDRSCAYASLAAILDVEEPEHTCVALFYDKEEIGSDGNTGAKACILEEIVELLLERQGESPQARRRVLMASRAISADVTGGLDPDYPEVHEKRNAARLGYGVCFHKYGGSGGKYSTSDANAEYVAWIRRIFNEHGVIWQAGELGKIDEGGGGTIAKYLAIHGLEIIDCGTPLALHAFALRSGLQGGPLHDLQGLPGLLQRRYRWGGRPAPPSFAVGATRWVALALLVAQASRREPPEPTGGAACQPLASTPGCNLPGNPAFRPMKPPTLLILDLQLRKKVIIFMVQAISWHSFLETRNSKLKTGFQVWVNSFHALKRMPPIPQSPLWGIWPISIAC